MDSDDREELIRRVLIIAESFELGRWDLPWPRTYYVSELSLEVWATPVPEMDQQAPRSVRIHLAVGKLTVVTITYPTKVVHWHREVAGPIALNFLRRSMVLEDLSRI
jgi:hypothetical protein